MKNQNVPLLITLFSIILVIAGINTTLLWDETGIGNLLSLFVSILGFILATVMLFFPSGIKWILISKVLAITTMLLPLVDEFFKYSNPIHIGGLALPLNLALIPVSIGSIAVIYLSRTIKTVT